MRRHHNSIHANEIRGRGLQYPAEQSATASEVKRARPRNWNSGSAQQSAHKSCARPQVSITALGAGKSRNTFSHKDIRGGRSTNLGLGPRHRSRGIFFVCTELGGVKMTRLKPISREGGSQ